MSGAIPKGFVRPKKDEESLTGCPLDKKIFNINNQGVEKKVPGLHHGWTEKRTFAKYIPPPVDENGVYLPGAQDMWLEVMESLEQDLKYLLSLPHHRFWSQIVYDPGVHVCLESYLLNARRNFDHDLTDDFSEPVMELSAPLEESVHHLVLLVFVRMATYKESKDNYITPSVFGDIIYENFLFDICKILDICVLYGQTNPQLISKMVGNIFTNQAKYYSDLRETIPTTSLALDNIEEKLGVAENLLPVALTNSNRQLSIEDVHDITLFLNDTLSSLQLFLTCHPAACQYFHEVSFEVRLSACYERIVPVMMEVLGEQANEPQLSLWISKLLKKIELARTSILQICRLLIQHKCFEPIRTDAVNPTLVGESVEKFLQVMSTCIGEKTFIADYCSVYPVKQDLEFFKQHDGDVQSLDFITDAVSTVMSEMGLTSDMKDSGVGDSTVKVKDASDTSGMNGYVETGSLVPSEVEVSSMVSHVLDLLPGLGEGFIQECLQYYSYSTEAVINALLEDSLPPSLVTLDRSLPAAKKPIPEKPPPPANTKDKPAKKVDFMDRANVYNNDEFDVFSRMDVDHSKVHKGKKDNKFVNDKPNENDREMLKEIARQYEERGGTSIYEDEFRLDEDAQGDWGWQYDDDYDDSYNINETGNIDVMPEAVKKRPGLIGAGRLNTHIDRNPPRSSSEDDNSDGEEKMENGVKMDRGENRSSSNQSGARGKYMGSKRGVQRIYDRSSSSNPRREETENKPRDHFQFCENPEVLRQRAEQRRQDRDANRYRGGYRGRENQGQQNGPNQGQQNGPTDDQYASRPKTSAASNRNSGKSWRQGQSGDDENKRYHGGKYKEDTNHGKAQSQSHRHKMMHKNEHKRAGAQAKFNKNN